jgi:putative GTP pyrophosphokinase
MSLEDINQINPAELEELRITAEELEAIQQDFINKAASYQEDAEYVTNKLLRVIGAHSVRYRIKSPDGLVKKILRKKRANKKRNITLETYEREMTDLAGIRVLHLFKGDWQLVHDYIKKTWKLKEKPIAYYREGDANKVLQMYTAQSCRVKKHPAGYRSVHYVIELSSSLIRRYIEIQVRTIFEEGWSEVDHKIRYPEFSDNPLTNSLLMMLNRMAGSADEMSDFVKDLNDYIITADQEYKRLEADKDEKIKKLEAIIANGKLSGDEADTLKSIANAMQHGVNPLFELQGMKDLFNEKAKELSELNINFAGGLLSNHIAKAMQNDKRLIDLMSKNASIGELMVKSARIDELVAKNAQLTKSAMSSSSVKVEKPVKSAGNSKESIIDSDVSTAPPSI